VVPSELGLVTVKETDLQHNSSASHLEKLWQHHDAKEHGILELMYTVVRDPIYERRREEAIVILQVMRHRLARAGIATAALFYDIINAFRSLAWPTLDTSLAGARNGLVSRRHREAICIIADLCGKHGAFRIGSGNRQGDRPAAQQFGIAFGKLWLRHDAKEHGILELLYSVVCDPISGQRVYLGSLLFADDAVKLFPFYAPSGAATNLIRRLCLLRNFLAPHGLALSDDKLQLLPLWPGRGGSIRLRRFVDALQGSA